MSEVTRILTAIEQGDQQISREVLPCVYDELRRMAAHKMSTEPAGHTLQPTTLVHEAWLKLVDSSSQSWQMRRRGVSTACYPQLAYINEGPARSCLRTGPRYN